MKKVSFGSFPLTEIRADDRKCLDRYLIKSFADNISISDAIRNLSITKDLMYITPDTLMTKWLKGDLQSDINEADRTSNTMYDKALKRAFFVMKEFYKKIKDANFYKEYVYYPIYVEKIEKIQVATNSNGDGSHTQVNMNYSFVILSNDLTKGLKIDEIKYDENASLNFLFLFVEFFSGPEFGRSIHDFNQKDYEFLVKLYQFVDKSGKDPIHMILTLYKLLGLIKNAMDGKISRLSTGRQILDNVGDIDIRSLQKYRGMIKHQLVDVIAKTSGSGKSKVPAIIYQKAFMDLMESIFKSEGLSGLYNGVPEDADRGQRLAYVYNTNKYREILNVAKELVEYNKLDCKNVISDDPMDFDFHVENGGTSIQTQSHVISQRYQTFFKTYVESIKDYLTGLVETIMSNLNLVQVAKGQTNILIDQNKAYLQQNIDALNVAKSNLKPSLFWIEDAENDLDRLRQNPNTTPDELKNARHKLFTVERQQRQYETDIINRTKDIKDIENILKLTIEAQGSVEKIIQDQSRDLYEKISDNILGSIANDLTFIYDDGKRFFTNELATEGYLKLINKQGYDLTNPNGDEFQKIADKAADQSIFPDRIPDNIKNRVSSTKDGKMPNPEFYAAEVVKALDDSFEVMTGDTIDALKDHLQPAIQKALQSAIPAAASSTSGAAANPFNNLLKTKETLTQEILEKLLHTVDTDQAFNAQMKNHLKNNIYRNRFIKHVLINFKKMFKLNRVDKEIRFDKSISQLHPLIKKLVKQGDKCQYFKSFIVSYDVVEQLYNLKYITDTKKFLYGLTNEPPRKMSNQLNKLQLVIEDYLGLKNNPTWILSKAEVYLSMPDSLSLTNTSLLSKIPKSELMQVCKIKASDYWNETNLGKVSQLGNKKLSDLNKKLEQANAELSDAKKSKNGKNKNGKNESIKRAQKKIDAIEEKISKAKLDDKQYLPQAFLFNDDPNMAENEPLLSDAEKQDLERNKENMLQRLHDLNPYDDDELETMQSNIKDQTQRSHPFDFETPEKEVSRSEQAKHKFEDDNAAFEEFLKQREAFDDFKKRRDG